VSWESRPHHAVTLFGKQVLQTVGMGAKGAVEGENNLGRAGRGQTLKNSIFGTGIVEARGHRRNPTVEVPTAQVNDGKGQAQTFTGYGRGNVDLAHRQRHRPQALAAIVLLLTV
jgi:hypothetical protein